MWAIFTTTRKAQVPSVEESQVICSAHAVIVPELTSPESAVVHTWSDLTHPLHSPHILLDTSNEGSFFFDGHTGQVGIAFALPVSPFYICIDVSSGPRHIPLSLSPRYFTLWGLKNGPDELYRGLRSRNFAGSTINQFVDLLQFEFDPRQSLTQIFIVPPATISGMRFTVIILEVLGNWGGPMTYLHRIQVSCNEDSQLVIITNHVLPNLLINYLGSKI